MSDPMATARAEILRPKAISPPGDEFGREKEFHMAIEVNIREALKGEPNILEPEVQEQLFRTRDKVQNLGLSGKSLVDGVLLYLELEESLGPEKALQKLQDLCLRSSAKN